MNLSRRGALSWRRAVASDVPALSDFLREGEERRVGFSGRLIREAEVMREATLLPVLRLPSPLRGAVWLADARGVSASGADADVVTAGSAIAGAVLCHPSRLAFPIFPSDTSAGGSSDESEDDRDLALLSSSFSPASVIGMMADVTRYEAVLGLVPRASVPYRLMTRVERTSPPRGSSVPFYPGLSIRRAEPSDLEALTPLQVAYEREEVLTPIHKLNPAACRASLARALERQLVFAAEEGGVIVGKAATNARGFRVDQIGGVYTIPARRGRGVATALMAALLADILAQGRKPALFVKPDNTPARALYKSLGFEDIGDFRADYFEA